MEYTYRKKVGSYAVLSLYCKRLNSRFSGIVISAYSVAYETYVSKALGNEASFKDYLIRYVSCAW